jgi:hypothetical protein
LHGSTRAAAILASARDRVSLLKLVYRSLFALLFARALLPVALAEPSSREPAPQATVGNEAGAQLALSSGIFLPPEGGRLGLSVAGDARYGVALGKVTVAPGVRLAGFFRPGLAAVAPLATTRVSARVEVPLGAVGPYVLGGVGLGRLSEGRQQGLAYQVGGGVAFALGKGRFTLAAELTYSAITASDFRALFFGPCVTMAL